MSETVSRSVSKSISGVLLLLIGFAGLVTALAGGFGIYTDDLSCTYNPRCGTNVAMVAFGVILTFAGFLIGLGLLRGRPVEPVRPSQPIPDVVQGAGGPPAWALLCGALAFGVTLVCGFLALNWLLAYLADAGNPFSGLALLLSIGAGIVATGFLILGIMLFAKKQ